VTPKDHGRDPINLEALYLHNSARWTRGHDRPPIGSYPPRVEWSPDRWRHVTPKGQGRDPIIFEAPYLHNSARYMHVDDGPFIVMRWWWTEWSHDWQYLLFSYNNSEGWQKHCCYTI